MTLAPAAKGEPAVRAYFLRCCVEALDGLGFDAPVPDAVEETLDELRALHGLETLGFLPLGLLLPLARTATEQLGADGARRLVLESMRRAMGAPLWRRMILRAFEVFGLGLPGMARWVPHLYKRVFRDTGQLHVIEVSPDQARIEFHGVPALCFESPAYLAALGHALEFFFELNHSDGNVVLERCEPARGLLSYWLRVDARAGRERSG